MVKRRSLDKAPCPVARSLDVIGDWWSLLIVRDAFDGMRRFGEFQESLGIAKGILSARLRSLVSLGILNVIPASDGSAYHEYVLTKKGSGLFKVIVSLRQWGEDFLYAPGEPYPLLVDNRNGLPVPKLQLRSRDGRPVTPAQTSVRKNSRSKPSGNAKRFSEI